MFLLWKTLYPIYTQNSVNHTIATRCYGSSKPFMEWTSAFVLYLKWHRTYSLNASIWVERTGPRTSEKTASTEQTALSHVLGIKLSTKFENRETSRLLISLATCTALKTTNSILVFYAVCGTGPKQFFWCEHHKCKTFFFVSTSAPTLFIVFRLFNNVIRPKMIARLSALGFSVEVGNKATR